MFYIEVNEDDSNKQDPVPDKLLHAILKLYDIGEAAVSFEQFMFHIDEL
jgi:hypothetical protein